jgi:subtilase family serine protease
MPVETTPVEAGRQDSRMRKARIAAFAAGVGALAVTVIAAVAPAAPAAGGPAGGQPRLVLKPGVVRLGLVNRSGPSTTAECEKADGIACYLPGQLRTAYNLAPLYGNGITGKGRTIAIVDSFGSPTIRRDLAAFDRQFHYPAPPSFKIITPAGRIPAYNPNSDMPGWASETTLDVEYAHALAPGANILLVETPVSETEGVTGFPQIVTAEKYVINHGLADVISQSFSATEETFKNYAQLKPLRAAYTDASAHHVTVLAASGDSGAADVGLDQATYYPRPVTSWPDSDPLVTAVGGTRLKLSGGKYTSVAWNDTYDKAANEFFAVTAPPNPLASGGGKSEFFTRPAYQNGVRSVVGARRGVPDIAMSGACNGAVQVYESFGQSAGWSLICGTSEATPEFAAIVALADQVAGHRLGLINPRLYALSARHARGIVDVTSGNNTVAFVPAGASKPFTVQGYPARTGYDLVTGVGTINAASFVYELAGIPGH